jgi:hypothetical protein
MQSSITPPPETPQPVPPDPEPRRPPAPSPPLGAGPRHDEQPPNRAELVFFLGLLSLFLCWPLGLIAWVLGGADLRRIRKGELSSRKIGFLRAGRVLGITGTLLFAAILGCAAWVARSGVPDGFRDVASRWNPNRLFKKEPLPPKNLAFVGEWRGDKGTLIRINPDGSADFVTKNSKVTGGSVTIDEDSLTITLLGFSSKWHVDARPQTDEKGGWRMKLDGEVFTKKGMGDLVRWPTLFAGSPGSPRVGRSSG